MNYIFCFLLGCVLLIHTATGDCMYKGQRIRNDTVWAPDDCTICVCPSLPAKQEVKCTAVSECILPNVTHSNHSLSVSQSRSTIDATINGFTAGDMGITVMQSERVTLSPLDFLQSGTNLTERNMFFNITEPLLDGHGKLEHADRPGKPLQNFTLDDLNARRIRFTAPSVKKAIGKILDAKGIIVSFRFQAFNESDQRGDPFMDKKFYIRVLSSNVEGSLSKVINITVFQGQSEPLPADFFLVDDPDNDIKDLTYRMHVSPHEGRLVRFVEGIPTDVHEGIDETRDQFVAQTYRYQHNGGNLDPDWVEITVWDWKHHGTLRIDISVLPMDQSTNSTNLA